MAPKLSEDEIDDLVYLARTGDDADLTEMLSALAQRESATPAEILVAAKDEAKSTTLHMASGNGHVETVRKLLAYFEGRPQEEKQAFLDEPNEHGNTGLHWAALGGHMDTVKLLLDSSASPALANERNYVPLDLAMFNDHKEVAQYFLSFANKLETDNQEEGLNGAVGAVEIEVEDEGETKSSANATGSS